MYQPNQRVTVDLSNLTIKGVFFSQNAQKALGTIVQHVSTAPPVYLVELLFSSGWFSRTVFGALRAWGTNRSSGRPMPWRRRPCMDGSGWTR